MSQPTVLETSDIGLRACAFQVASVFTPRNQTLEVVRALAILLVVFGHGAYLLQPHGTTVSSHSLGIKAGMIGVEIFFVLSGYLMASIVVPKVTGGRFELKLFLVRRWLRTYPLFVFFFFLNVALYHGSDISGYADFRYLIFSQSIVTAHPLFFPEAWTLVIEEWFYLAVALMAVLATGAQSARKFVVGMVLLAAFSFVSRGAAVYWTDGLDWAEGFRKIASFRLDSLAIGSMCYFARHRIATMSARLRGSMFLVGLTSVVAGVAIYDERFFNATPAIVLYPTLNSLAIACCVACGVGLDMQLRGILQMAAARVSAWSYSMYLCNFPILVVFAAVAVAFEANAHQRMALALGYFATVLVVGFVLHHMIERPILAWREKRFASS